MAKTIPDSIKDLPAKYRGDDVIITRKAGQGDFTFGADGKPVPFNPALGPQVMIRGIDGVMERTVLWSDCTVE